MAEITVKLNVDITELQTKIKSINDSMAKTSIPHFHKVGKQAGKEMASSFAQGIRAIRYTKFYTILSGMFKDFGLISGQNFMEELGEIAYKPTEIEQGIFKIWEKNTKGIQKFVEDPAKYLGLSKKSLIPTGEAAVPIGSNLEIFFDALVGILQSINLQVIGIIFLLTVIMQGIGKLFIGIMSGFSGFMKGLEIIGKVLGLMVRPFADLFIPIFLLFARLLIPVARILRIILLPLYKTIWAISNTLIKAISGLGIMGKLAIGGVGGVLLEMVGPIMDALKSLIDVMTPYVVAFIEWIAKAVYTFLTTDLRGLTTKLTELFGPIGAGIGFVIEAFQFLISAVMGVAAQLGKGILEKVFGKEKVDKAFENIEKINIGFKLGADFGASIQLAWDIFSKLVITIGKWLFAFAANPLETVYESVTTTLDGIVKNIPGGDKIKQMWTDANTFFYGLKTFWDNILYPILDSVKSEIYKAFLNPIGPLQSLMSAFDRLKGVIESFNLPTFKTIAPELVSAQVGGDILETGPYLLHRGETVIPASRTVSGGASTQINITVNATGMDTNQLVRQISKELQRQYGNRTNYGTGMGL